MIFNRNTGEAVHTHITSDDVSISFEDLLALVDPSLDRKLLDIHIVNPSDVVSPGKLYRIDPELHKLKSASAEEIKGFGFGGGGEYNSRMIVHPIKTVYSQIRPNQKR